MVDGLVGPQRLEQHIGEAQRGQVLHRLLAEVVVDPEDRLGVEDRVERAVELARRLEIVPEGLLDHHATPRAVARLRQSMLLQLLRDLPEGTGRDRQVEGVVAAGAAQLVELLDRAPELGEGDVVVEGSRHEPEALRELLPDLLAELRARMGLDRVVHDLGEVLVGPVAPREADQAEARRQQPAVGEVVDRRHDLLAREVAGDPEQHQAAGSRDARQTPVERVAQRVAVRRAASRPSASHPSASTTAPN
ncbi:unannotated protein [freshwater metagenome]|uniref:Unannotated protein n=1 Tax=freshwater metagenome TaxID=449393 RepID=A0A6J6QA20_9ZZZZ